MRRFTWLLLFLPLSVLAHSPVRLTGLDINAAPTLSTFIFSLDQPVPGSVHYNPNAQTVTIDFENTRKIHPLKHMWMGSANVKSIDAIELNHDLLRYLLTVKDVISYKVHYLSTKEHKTKLELAIKTIPQSSKELKAAFNRDLLNVSDETYTPEPETTNHVFTVVIDAGHGGHDSGAVGAHGLYEKNVNLQIAKKLATEINREPNLRAVLTRSGDYFIPLRERLRIARKNKADVFIAIHADAHYDHNAEGISVFALSKHGATSEAARFLAQSENYSELNNVELKNLQDHSYQLRSVLLDLAQTVTIEDSLKLGNSVLGVLDTISTLHSNRVEQAPFVVLKAPDVPSILVETGFITNPREEGRLHGDAYQHQIAFALEQGIAQYVKNYASEQRSD